MHRTAERVLVCTCCGGTLRVRRKDWKNPIAMRRLRREMDLEHDACREFEGDPERARAERIFRKGMAQHADKLA